MHGLFDGIDDASIAGAPTDVAQQHVPATGQPGVRHAAAIRFRKVLTRLCKDFGKTLPRELQDRVSRVNGPKSLLYGRRRAPSHLGSSPT